jgi:hypothetical protein
VGVWSIVGSQSGDGVATALLKRMVEFANIIPFSSVSFVRNLLSRSSA